MKIETNSFEITEVQLFDYIENIQTGENEYEINRTWSANIIINDEFVLQTDSAGNSNICWGFECYWNDEKRQDYASENIKLSDVLRQIDIQFCREWIVENHNSEIMNPENSQGTG